jgi:acetoin utilization deacetylase AcuC-like enzyme
MSICDPYSNIPSITSPDMRAFLTAVSPALGLPQRRALSLSSRRLVEWNHRPDEPISEGLAKASGTETTETDDPIRHTEDVLAQLARAAPKDDNDVAVPAWNSDDGVSRDMVKEAESSTQAWLQSVLQLKE